MTNFISNFPITKIGKNQQVEKCILNCYLKLSDSDSPEDKNANHGHHHHDQDVVQLKIER
jgi:hypothetical protein